MFFGKIVQQQDIDQLTGPDVYLEDCDIHAINIPNHIENIMIFNCRIHSDIELNNGLEALLIDNDTCSTLNKLKTHQPLNVNFLYVSDKHSDSNDMKRLFNLSKLRHLSVDYHWYQELKDDLSSLKSITFLNIKDEEYAELRLPINGMFADDEFHPHLYALDERYRVCEFYQDKHQDLDVYAYQTMKLDKATVRINYLKPVYSNMPFMKCSSTLDMLDSDVYPWKGPRKMDDKSFFYYNYWIEILDEGFVIVKVVLTLCEDE
jgi:hypothetical protein